MNDRELLEQAAKAAGLYVCNDLNFLGLKEWGPGLWVKPEKFGSYELWDPLSDDGDAFRLAVALKMQTLVQAEWVEVLIDGVRMVSCDICYAADGCLLETTRRAIVRAAAAIGAAL